MSQKIIISNLIDIVYRKGICAGIGYFTVNLEPGKYALISEVPNASEKNLLKTFVLLEWPNKSYFHQHCICDNAPWIVALRIYFSLTSKSTYLKILLTRIVSFHKILFTEFHLNHNQQFILINIFPSLAFVHRTLVPLTLWDTITFFARWFTKLYVYKISISNKSKRKINN